jgi:imidazoleglycerol-phosphate dehydratase
MTREAIIKRETRETHIDGRIVLDGTGQADVHTGIGFFDHMLTAFAFNALFDLTLKCDGDLFIDQHHTVEDVGIALGEATLQAVGDRLGLVRYGHAMLPMDEALVLCALDLSGRPFVRCQIDWQPNLGTSAFDYALVSEFHWGFARSMRATIHLHSLTGGNNHHLCEASFKAFGRALAQAVALDPRRLSTLPSTKGHLE